MDLRKKRSFYYNKLYDNLYRFGAVEGCYLVVNVECHEYGFEMHDVIKITDCSELFRLPGLPNHLYGGVFVDGGSVPVIDLCARFNRGKTVPGQNSMVVVVNVDGEHIGMLVDGTCGIRKVSPRIVDRSRKYITRIRKEFINGMITFEKNTFFVLDVSAISYLDIGLNATKLN